MEAPSLALLDVAASTLAGVAHRTPVLTSRLLDERLGCQVFLKAENMQRTGSFKFRGAYFALSQLSVADREKGVITFSSGNHGAALAYAGSILGVPVVVIMPRDAPPNKIAATRMYGAEVILYDRNEEDRAALGDQVAQERGLTLVPPYDHPDIVAGQSTVAREFLAQQPDLDALVVCVGGGGLLGGCSLYARQLKPDLRIIGVEPDAGNDAVQSFETGLLVSISVPETIADGAQTTSMSQMTFELMRRNVDEMVSVSDRSLLEVTRFLAELVKTVVEPTGALAVAALWEGKVSLHGKKVGCILSGGNANVVTLSQHWQTLS